MLRTALAIAVVAIGLTTALSVGALLWVSLDEIEQRRQSAQIAERRAAALGVCVVELLMLEPGTRTFEDVRHSCPEGVVELMMRERRRP